MNHPCPQARILPLAQEPDDDDDDDETESATAEVERTIAKLAGKIMGVESNRLSGDGGVMDAPKEDWKVNRVGADFKQPLVELRRDADSLILGLCGVPIEFLTGADGAALREAYRRMLFGTIQPLGAIVQEELSAKLETPITLTWDELRAADRASGARAYKALREAEMSHDDALRYSGL